MGNYQNNLFLISPLMFDFFFFAITIYTLIIKTFREEICLNNN